VKQILAKPAWAGQNRRARLIIRLSLSEDDKTAIRHLESAGEIWNHLIKDKKSKTEIDKIEVIQKVTR
jgi:hypothetical protein